MTDFVALVSHCIDRNQQKHKTRVRERVIGNIVLIPHSITARKTQMTLSNAARIFTLAASIVSSSSSSLTICVVNTTNSSLEIPAPANSNTANEYAEGTSTATSMIPTTSGVSEERKTGWETISFVATAAKSCRVRET